MQPTIVILAGGLSSRMGQDKGLVMLNNRTMIEPIIAVAKEITHEIFISTNNQAYQKFGYPIIEDVYFQYGPLGGILSAFKNINANKILVLSCDIPFINTVVLDRLIQNHVSEISVSKYEEKIHPLIGIYSKSCMHKIQEQLEQNDFKVQNLFSKCTVDYVNMNDLNAVFFRNINSTNDL